MFSLFTPRKQATQGARLWVRQPLVRALSKHLSAGQRRELQRELRLAGRTDTAAFLGVYSWYEQLAARRKHTTPERIRELVHREVLHVRFPHEVAILFASEREQRSYIEQAFVEAVMQLVRDHVGSIREENLDTLLLQLEDVLGSAATERLVRPVFLSMYTSYSGRISRLCLELWPDRYFRELRHVGITESEFSKAIEEKTEEVARQGRRLRTILDSLADSVLILDGHQRLVEYNNAAGKLLGLKASDGNRPIGELLQWRDTSPGVHDPIEEHWQTGATISYGAARGLEVKSASGTHAVSVSVAPVQVGKGRHGAVVTLRGNQQDRRVLEGLQSEVAQGEAILSSTIASLPLGLMIFDQKLRVVLTNTVATWLIGETSQKVSCSVLASHLQIPELATALKAAISKQTPYEGRGQTLQGRHVRVTAVPVLEGTKCLGVTVLLLDVTEQEELNRSRDEFFSIASHELRTPLTAIRGYAQMLHEVIESTNERATKYIHSIELSAAQLTDVANDFLHVVQLEQRKVTYDVRPIPIQEVAADVVSSLASLAQAKNLRLTLKVEPATVAADVIRVSQVLTNLVGNAIKYTDEGSVEVRSELRGAFYCLLVVDTGRGIAKEQQTRLFEKFHQAEDSLLARSHSHGTGLGLYIARKLAEGMSCRVFLDQSELGKGSTFALEIPLTHTK